MSIIFTIIIIILIFLSKPAISLQNKQTSPFSMEVCTDTKRSFFSRRKIPTVGLASRSQAFSGEEKAWRNALEPLVPQECVGHVIMNRNIITLRNESTEVQNPRRKKTCLMLISEQTDSHMLCSFAGVVALATVYTQMIRARASKKARCVVE